MSARTFVIIHIFFLFYSSLESYREPGRVLHKNILLWYFIINHHCHITIWSAQHNKKRNTQGKENRSTILGKILGTLSTHLWKESADNFLDLNLTWIFSEVKTTLSKLFPTSPFPINKCWDTLASSCKVLLVLNIALGDRGWQFSHCYTKCSNTFSPQDCRINWIKKKRHIVMDNGSPMKHYERFLHIACCFGYHHGISLVY